MIGIIFQFGAETVEVRVKDSSVYFRENQFKTWADIDGLKLDRSGVIKEFPELKDDEDWQSKARERFKEKMKTMKTEKERAEYVLDDLSKFGYIPRYWQQSGFRPVKL